MLPRIASTFLLVFASVALAARARAAIVTLDFTGSVYLVQDQGVFDGSLGVGTPFHLHAVYDESALPSRVQNLSNATDTTWDFSTPPNQVSLSLGSYAPQLDAFSVQLQDGYTDYYELFGNTEVAGLRAYLDLALSDADGTAIARSQLSDVPFTLDAWDPGVEGTSTLVFELDAPNDVSGVAAGQIERIDVARVPEASAGLLIALLAAALGVRTRF